MKKKTSVILSGELLYRGLAIAVGFSQPQGGASASFDSGVTPLPQVKILDLGLARISDVDIQAATVMTEVGMIKGTLPRMSPEQCEADPHDSGTRGDVYTLEALDTLIWLLDDLGKAAEASPPWPSSRMASRCSRGTRPECPARCEDPPRIQRNARRQERDRVAVYPMFEAVDVSPILRLRDRPLKRTCRGLSTSRPEAVNPHFVPTSPPQAVKVSVENNRASQAEIGRPSVWAFDRILENNRPAARLR